MSEFHPQSVTATQTISQVQRGGDVGCAQIGLGDVQKAFPCLKTFLFEFQGILYKAQSRQL